MKPLQLAPLQLVPKAALFGQLSRGQYAAMPRTLRALLAGYPALLATLPAEVIVEWTEYLAVAITSGGDAAGEVYLGQVDEQLTVLDMMQRQHRGSGGIVEAIDSGIDLRQALLSY